MVEVLKYVHNHINEKLSAEGMAKKFGYSRWYFSEKFHNFAGTTFVDYVRNYRLQLAANDILNGKKIIDIAYDCGYESVGGFNKAFFAMFGMSPKEYLKKYKEAQLNYEKRRLLMNKLTDRCEALREEVVVKKEYSKNYFATREVYYKNGIFEARKLGLDNMQAIGYAISNILEKFEPFIIPGELITGYNYGDSECGGEWYRPKNEEKDLEILALNKIPKAEIEEYFETQKGKKIPSFNFEGAEEPFTEVEQMADDEWAAIGRFIGSNHTVLSYESVVKYGFSGLLEKVEEYEEKNGSNSLYKSAKMILKSAIKMGEKYAEKAEELKNNPLYNEKDLEFIIENCRQVPKKPAKTFAQAVQSIWFAHIINTWDDLVNANSLGRLDQILYPYYKKDIEDKILTKEEAYEIICCLWLKLYRDYDVQQCCVGGTTVDDKSAVNELSYMMLDATEQLDFIRCMSVRFSKATEKKFIERALEVVGHVGKGVPFFFNDDVMIPALMNSGISKEDAYNYTQLGCIETTIPGKSNPHAVSGEINLLKAIEYVLNNGKSMVYDYKIGVETGDISKFTTYRKFLDAVKIQIENLVDIGCAKVTKKAKEGVKTCPKPYKSILTEGCIEQGLDFNNKGAKYDYYQIMLCAIPNISDSLAAIKKLVYEEKKYTLSQLKEILANNFEDEAVRLEFLNKAPKFGNDIDYVDGIAIDITNFACDIVEKMSGKYGLKFHSQLFTYYWCVDHGEHSAASADGRRKGENIAYSISPMGGRDFNGLTAVFNSISKLPTKRTPGTASAIIEVEPKLFNDMNIEKLADILIVSGANGLSNVQFNTVDAETLIDAKIHPENHRNLAVRVSGYSQKFNLLTDKLQDHIISRTKHNNI